MSQKKNPSPAAASDEEFILRAPRGLPPKEAKEFAIREVYLAVTPLPASAATLPPLFELSDFSAELDNQEKLVADAEAPREWARGEEGEEDGDNGEDMGEFEPESSDDGESEGSDEDEDGDNQDEDESGGENDSGHSPSTTLYVECNPSWGAQVTYSSPPRWSPAFSPSSSSSLSSSSTASASVAKKAATMLLAAVAKAYSPDVINPPRAAFARAPTSVLAPAVVPAAASAAAATTAATEEESKGESSQGPDAGETKGKHAEQPAARRRTPRTLSLTPTAEAEACTQAIEAHCAAIETALEATPGAAAAAAPTPAATAAATTASSTPRFITVLSQDSPSFPSGAVPPALPPVAPARRRALWAFLRRVCAALEALGGAAVAQVTVGTHVPAREDGDEDEDEDDDGDEEKEDSKSKSKGKGASKRDSASKPSPSKCPSSPLPSDYPRELRGLGLSAYDDGGVIAALWSAGCPSGASEELVWIGGADGAAPRWMLLAPLPAPPAPRPVLPGPRPGSDEEGCVPPAEGDDEVDDDVDVEGDAPRDVGQCVMGAVGVAAHAAEYAGTEEGPFKGVDEEDLAAGASEDQDASADNGEDGSDDDEKAEDESEDKAEDKDDIEDDSEAEDEDSSEEQEWKLCVEFATSPPDPITAPHASAAAAAAAAAAKDGVATRDEGVRASFAGVVRSHSRHGPGAAVLGDGALLTGTWLKGKFSGIGTSVDHNL